MPLACSHLKTVVSKHAQNKNSPAHLHMQMWNLKRLPAMPVGPDQSWIKVTSLHFNVLSAALGLTWSWAILKLDFTGHNSQVSFSRNIRNSSRRVLQGYKREMTRGWLVSSEDPLPFNLLKIKWAGKNGSRKSRSVKKVIGSENEECQSGPLPDKVNTSSLVENVYIKVEHYKSPSLISKEHTGSSHDHKLVSKSK